MGIHFRPNAEGASKVALNCRHTDEARQRLDSVDP
jgi:hypothetical protein